MTTPSSDQLAEKEFNLIQEIAKNPSRTQRELSNSVGLSLGTTNLLIKRLVRKGFIKVSQLNWNKTQYILTLEGILEKANKSYNYARYTLRIFRQIQDNISTVLQKEYSKGQKHFVIVAQDELLGVIKEVAEGLVLADARFHFVNRFKDVPQDADLVLTAILEAHPAQIDGRRYITLVDFDNIDFRIR